MALNWVKAFSQMKLIKNSRRTCLGEDTLDQLLRINIEGPPPCEMGCYSCVRAVVEGDKLVDLTTRTPKNPQPDFRRRRLSMKKPHSFLLMTGKNESHASEL